MSRFILPIILTASAIGLFVMYTNPTYQGPSGIKALQAQVSSYDDALNKSQELKKVRDDLVNRRNAFPDEHLQKLEKILPDNVDNIRLVIDINNIASRHSLALKNVQLGSLSDSAKTRSALAVGSSGSAVGSVQLGFVISASYANFLAFLVDLEHSLRVIDIEKISFTAGDKGVDDYSFSIRTYWLH